MASMTMTCSFLGTATTNVASPSPATSRRRLVVVVASASSGAEGGKIKLHLDAKKECNNGRRDLMFAAAAAAICSAAGIAVAEPPKAGTSEARKFYAPVCVTMPTAKVCHK